MISSRQDQTVVTANQFYDIYFITTKYICHFNNVGPSGALLPGAHNFPTLPATTSIPQEKLSVPSENCERRPMLRKWVFKNNKIFLGSTRPQRPECPQLTRAEQIMQDYNQALYDACSGHGVPSVCPSVAGWEGSSV